ncbi:hypothetical protein ACVNNN_07785 [Lysinibacillus fusiformis]|uniref:hypothetical protein n=1 Tax=Lysinibacillus sp. PWR01 TaxID=3342384 RepID=UPI00372D6BE6
MILINVNKEEIAEKHLNALKNRVINRIQNQYSKFTPDGRFNEYKKLLDYFNKNLNTLLVGELNDLKQVITKIEKDIYISSSKLKSILTKREQERVTARDGTLRSFIQRNNLEPYLDKIRTIEYNNLGEFKTDINKLIEMQTLSIANTNKEMTFEEAIFEIFSYNDFSEFKKDRTNVWDAYEYTSYLNNDVCPYCDRQFTFTFIDLKREKRARAVLDHFYSKSLYPYLSIAIFNLIPCCHVCNSTFKLNRDLYNNEIVYPFEEEFHNNVEFRVKNLSYKSLVGLDANIEIFLKVITADEELKEKIDKSIELFSLNEIYTAHNVYVKSLIRNLYINSEGRINEILNHSGLFNDIKEIEDILFLGMNREVNLGKQVLSKLTFDIIKQYKLE